ncbi:MAG TPA: HAMP domain-containing sensor histidine kinase [Solirubrobacteraceae bacterium]|nr:HAMP domain-containing sensor histidine kinase [Solirubrobacteraceae bacterium]
MTLRNRMGAVAALAVALAVVAVAIAVYIAVRSELRGQIDSALADRAQPFVMQSRPGPGPGPGADRGGANARIGLPGGGFGAGFGRADRFRGGSGGRGERVRDRAGSAGRFVSRRGSGRPGSGGPGAGSGGPGAGSGGPGARSGAAPPGSGGSDPGGGQGAAAAASTAPFGGASGHVQFISPTGAVSEPPDESSSYFAPTAAAKAIAASGQGRLYADMQVRGTHLRVLTVGRGASGAVQVARPLTEVDHVLSNLLLVLALVGAGGIVLAAILGGVVARTALAPVARFTKRTEKITVNPDLSQRLEVQGNDELARLARSFNTTLEALARSVESQRHLIADAGHELRTPIASLRANIQVLEDADRLPKHELESLRADIVEELDELTALVADIVELARGAKPGQSLDDVRLDALVQSQIDRSRRRASDLTFEAQLEPTVVSGDPERINRAVSNLLDNARKWSPPGGVIEVSLSNGVLAIRDHGPGFEAQDLPHIFDRFYRAGNARRMPGSGLGLAIVRQAAESHGGSVKAENADGGGALLTLSFGSSAGVVEAEEGSAVRTAGYS